jgi:hypothetical protein
METNEGHPARIIFWFLAIGLGLYGLLMLIAAGQGNTAIRLIIGLVCLAGAGGLVYLARMQPVVVTNVHKMEVDLPGKVDLKSQTCNACGATLDSGSVKVVSGAVQVNCPYCGTSYQLEEAPKW